MPEQGRDHLDALASRGPEPRRVPRERLHALELEVSRRMFDVGLADAVREDLDAAARSMLIMSDVPERGSPETTMMSVLDVSAPIDAQRSAISWPHESALKVNGDAAELCVVLFV